MDVYQRPGSPFYYYDVDVPLPGGGTKRIRKSTKCRVKAEAKRVMVSALAREQASASRKRRGLLVDVMADYAANLKAEKQPWAGPAAHYRLKVFGLEHWATKGRFALPIDLTCDALTEQHLERLKRARRAEGNASGTIGHELRVIRAAINQAKRSLGIAAPDVEWATPSSDRKTRWLSVEEWHRIYDELEPTRLVKLRGGHVQAPHAALVAERQQTRDLFVALTLCGGRWGEVSRMTADQVLPSGRVRLYGWKTGKERIVPVPVLMAGVLERRANAARDAGSPYLFPRGKDGHRPSLLRKADTAPRAWQTSSDAIPRAFVRAGVNEAHLVERDGKATIHSLRHTFASWLLQSGEVSLAEVQELLGHSTIELTRRYSHLETGVMVDRAAATIGAVLGRAA